VNARFLKAFERMSSIHGVPVVAVNWPCDSEYELVRDGSEACELAELVRELFSRGFDFSGSRVIARLREEMAAEASKRIAANPEYARPPPSVRIVGTRDLARLLRARFTDPRLPRLFASREESVVYTFEMTEECCRRGDPYTGMQFIYDYLWCRSGPSVDDKNRNLVLECPKVRASVWLRCNPNMPGLKSHLYYVTADAIVLRDSLIATRG